VPRSAPLASAMYQDFTAESPGVAQAPRPASDPEASPSQDGPAAVRPPDLSGVLEPPGPTVDFPEEFFDKMDVFLADEHQQVAMQNLAARLVVIRSSTRPASRRPAPPPTTKRPPTCQRRRAAAAKGGGGGSAAAIDDQHGGTDAPGAGNQGGTGVEGEAGALDKDDGSYMSFHVAGGGGSARALG